MNKRLDSLAAKIGDLYSRVAEEGRKDREAISVAVSETYAKAYLQTILALLSCSYDIRLPFGEKFSLNYSKAYDRLPFLVITDRTKIEGFINEAGLFLRFTDDHNGGLCLKEVARKYLDLAYVNKLLSPYGVVVEEDGASCTYITYYKDPRAMSEVKGTSVIPEDTKKKSKTI